MGGETQSPASGNEMQVGPGIPYQRQKRQLRAMDPVSTEVRDNVSFLDLPQGPWPCFYSFGLGGCEGICQINTTVCCVGWILKWQERKRGVEFSISATRNSFAITALRPLCNNIGSSRSDRNIVFMFPRLHINQ